MPSDDLRDGLSAEVAAARLAEEGPNLLPASGPKPTLAIVRDVLKEPMFLLLVACGLLYLLLGEPRDSAMLLVAVFVVIAITIVQERRTERALEALRDLSSPRALVIRDGERRRIPGAEVVRGDLIVLSEGDRVAADARLRWARHLACDESLLTGESVPVRKRPGEAERAEPGGDDQPFVYSGSLVVSGQGVAEVTATGERTAMGRIGKALEELAPVPSALQLETSRLVRVVAVLGLGLCVVIALVYALTRGDWLGGLLFGLSTAMAMLPEEFPVVLTVFLALGAWRLSRRKVLTRRMQAIETLGSTTVLCADKTGTLTENRMVVRALVVSDARVTDPGPDLAEDFHFLVETAILASRADPFDPMERAFRDLGVAALSGTEHLHPDWNLVQEYPLTPELLAMSRAWDDGTPRHVVAAKGAPEAVFELCHLAPEAHARWDLEVSDLARQGLRVLAVAAARAHGTPPPHQHDYNFELVGLVGLWDPVREDVPDAIARCRGAGIRVVMITGDYPETARSIAAAAGLEADVVLTGAELAALDDAALVERVRRVTVCARVVPEQKLRLVQALQADGEVVAMTGDGVNDAPALKAAHIGIAMGERGTDVAREAASLVLVDDSFASLVRAVAHGRRVFANLRKAMAYVVAIHVPIAGIATVPVFAGWPIALLPVHIALMELVIDPACSIVFEAEPAEAGAMEERPRPPGTRMLPGRLLLGTVLQGLAAFAAVLGAYAWALGAELDGDEARTVAFVTLLGVNVGLITINRSFGSAVNGALRNRTYVWVVGGAVAVVALLVYVPGVSGLFHFVPLTLVELAVSGGAALAGSGLAEVAKRLVR